tara:strand:+ start:51716 stop:51937 length:222 start_codon:yes stop_codon:yes gene_type:complete
MSKAFFNPLDHVEASTVSAPQQGIESNSKAMVNDDPSKCPKCSGAMSVSSILDRQESVYYCGKCRVTNPMLAE